MLDDTPIGFVQSYVVMGSGAGWRTRGADAGVVDTPDGPATLMRVERGIR
jgi:hypothetical protein